MRPVARTGSAGAIRDGIWEIDMRRLLTAGGALLVLGCAMAAQATEKGVVGGAVTGAVGGAVVAGPVGAVVGGVGGAVVGNHVTNHHRVRHHRRAEHHPDKS